MIRLTPTQITVDAAAADGLPSRSITGVAVTYDTVATVLDGTQVKFLQGSLPVTGRDPKLYMQHDAGQIVGKVVERVDTPDGMMFTARISKTRAGDEALTLALDGVISEVSVGVTPTKFSYDKENVMVIEAANWSELSLVSEGAFSGAVITDVAASKPDDPAEGIPQTEPQADIQSEQATKEDKTMSETQETPVAEAATSTVDKLWATAKVERQFAMPTPGEYMAAMHIGGEAWRQVNAAYKQNIAKQQTAIQAALAQDLTTDTPGLLPTPVLGPVFEDLNFVRPVVSALGVRAMPNGNGKAFIRPTITQHTTAATQTEGAAVSSTKMTIASNSVTRTTVAGGVFISQQDIDFSDPSAQESILRDLTGEYLIATDNIAADALVAGATASGSTWTVNQTNPASLITGLYDAAREIQEDTNFTPTHIFASPDVWEKIGRQLDADSRPVFGYANSPSLLGVNVLGTSNELSYLGTNVMGLQLIVDNNFAANTLLVVRATGFECYENVRGIMTKEDPELLGRNFTYYGYFATFVADATMIQSIAIA